MSTPGMTMSMNSRVPGGEGWERIPLITSLSFIAWVAVKFSRSCSKSVEKRSSYNAAL